MAKDPAFLFYPGDFMAGTQTFTREEKGAYMDLLCLQFHRGPMPLEIIKRCLNGDFDRLWPFLKEKFSQDNEGNFFNQRLETEKNKRANFSESRRKNRIKKEVKKTSSTYETTYVSHMENENENRNKTVIDSLKGVQGETFEEKWNEAFGEIYMDALRAKYRFLDLQGELEHFRLKCDSDPKEYHTRDPGGLRLGFLKQLKGEANKPKKENGTLKIINDKLKADALIDARIAAKKAG